MGERPAKKIEADGANIAWSIVSLLLAGILAWGGIGWLLDHFLGTAFFLPFGIIVGAAGSMYLVIKRFGSAPPAKSSDEGPQQDSTGKTK